MYGGGCRWMRMGWMDVDGCGLMRSGVEWDGMVVRWCGGGFIHISPLGWDGSERRKLPSSLTAGRHMGCSPLFHFFALCLPCSPSRSSFPLSSSNSFELPFCFPWDPMLLPGAHCLIWSCRSWPPYFLDRVCTLHTELQNG